MFGGMSGRRFKKYFGFLFSTLLLFLGSDGHTDQILDSSQCPPMWDGDDGLMRRAIVPGCTIVIEVMDPIR